jgi:hypothetical protein
LPEFESWSGHEEFVVDKAALGQDFSEYFYFPCQSFRHTHHHPSSGAGTLGKISADVPNGLSFTSPQEI